MKDFLNNFVKLFIFWIVSVFLVASCSKAPYSNVVQCKITELALVGYEYSAHTIRFMDFFCMRRTFMHPHFMAKLEGDTFECASYLSYWSTNPFQLCHPNYLVVSGKAPKNSGAH